MVDNFTAMPSSMVAGDSLSVEFGTAATDYPASEGWGAALVLVPEAGGTPLSITCTGGVTSWLALITPTQSAALVAGSYVYSLRASKSGERKTIVKGSIEVLPDLVANQDQRSKFQRILDAIDAVLENRASSSDLRVRFEDGREIERVPHADLIKLRDYYARKVANEKHGRTGPKRILSRL